MMKHELDLVYIIDDDESIVYPPDKLLRPEHFCKRTMMFGDVFSALAKLKESLIKNENVPDAILFDIAFPAIHGWEFMNEFRNLSIDIPAFVFTSMINPADNQRLYQYNAIEDFITRPLARHRQQKIPRLANT